MFQMAAQKLELRRNATIAAMPSTRQEWHSSVPELQFDFVSCIAQAHNNQEPDMMGGAGTIYSQGQSSFTCSLSSEQFTTLIDYHNITGEFIPEDHGFDGLLSVALPGYSQAMDSRMIQAMADLPDEFPFNKDYNSGYHLGIGWEQLTVHNGTRISSETGLKYLSRPNLYVLIHSYATRILESNCTTKGVKTFDTMEFTQDAGETIYTLSPAKEILLSTGSIGTLHILLYSGRTSLITRERSLAKQDVPEEALAKWEANCTGYIMSTSGNQLGFLRNGIPQEPIPPTGNYFMILAIVVCSLACGDITINSTNPLDPPLINPNLLRHPQDLTIMQATINMSERSITAPTWDGYILEFMSNTTKASHS
ncbi:uncharacterized protein EV420DRAFT_1731023 [Desarmillaria tabescens]|uniref:Uncharacterized protein n=1 Tax=Armillaria tabescens TaxID=1929756 RepID=A0AA39JCW7_ARMTA|nr:uncharacterized protein EV420DRAFT_1731023 [Desarmillaria tabescens]KAK0440455.1 hypothetical protein EV420DRAFT_1731023 [Desarmillaria tabescens]